MTDQGISVAPPAHGAPSIDGWQGVCTAVHSARQLDVPLLITVTSDDHKPLWIDMGEDLFYWEQNLEELPVAPVGVVVYSQPIGPDPVSAAPPWRSTEPLLWQLCTHAFGAERASWMRANDRWKLLRWPNLTEIRHTSGELRMVAALSHGFFTAEELAVVTGTVEPEAQRMLNVLSLLGAVESASGPILPPPMKQEVAAAAPEKRFGLLGKLRSRLGV